jgi:hypothetical protein
LVQHHFYISRGCPELSPSPLGVVPRVEFDRFLKISGLPRVGNPKTWVGGSSPRESRGDEEPWSAPNLRSVRDFLSGATTGRRPVLCAASIHLVLDASLPRALCAVSRAPPTSMTRPRCPCPPLRLVSCHPLQLLRRDNRPKPKSLRYYSIPIGDPKKAGHQPQILEWHCGH